jgi:hypothetical protein
MRKYIILIFLFPILSSCEQAFFEDDKASVNPYENFEYLWKQCDEKYSYFDLKGIDWNEIKDTYKAKLYMGMTEDSLFSVLGAMLTELKDDHTNLISNFNISRYGVKYQGQDNFDWRIIEDNYLPKKYSISGPFSHSLLQESQIAYVRFPEFTGTIDETNLDYILEKYQGLKGLILDLRENGGGAVSDVFALLSRFVVGETVVNYSRIKNGKGHNDFLEAEPVKVKPYNGIQYLQKIAVLTDRGTYSAGSFTALATKALRNIILVGDTTGGGLGLPNGGQLPNGWTYRFSISQALTLDLKPDYEQGVPPDVHVLFDWSNRERDEILERAIEELMK